jgi:hypothetical protein
MESSQWESFFLNRFLMSIVGSGVGQGMNRTELYLWHLECKAQCDRENHQTSIVLGVNYSKFGGYIYRNVVTVPSFSL